MTDQFYFSTRTIQRLKRIQSMLDQLQPEAESRALLVPGSPQPRSGVIVFPGSFNPPTTAHIALLKQAQQFAQQHEPMSLYAAFSKHTVDKEAVERPLLLDRILLLERVLRRRVARTGILLFNRGLYVEEAEAIRRSFPHVKRILFLLGFDKIVQILDARYYKDRDASLVELFHSAELLVAPRGNAGEQELSNLLQQEQNKRFARFIHLLPFNAAYRNVSSTEVRQGIAGSNHAVPQEVRQFIRETRAYMSPLQRRDGSVVDYYGQRMQYLQRILAGKL
jgi:nicotinic acid mononucleotide adenylyltransferase